MDIDSQKTTQPESATVRSGWRRAFSLLWKVALAVVLIPIVQVLILKFVNPPFSTMMLYESVEHLFSGESMSFSHTNLSWNEMPDAFVQAAIAGEDQKFFDHNGFDWEEIDHAQKEHERHPNRPMRGASTLSQQVAKNLFLPPWHSFIRKGVEAYYTVLIEFFWSKQRILQMYANIAQLGPNEYGVEAGSLYHFHKHASELSASESARLAATLPNPERWSASHPSPYIVRRSERILRQMRGLPTSEEEDGDPD
jgi:monofunctional biosynthetic peptidoglycan transglycosylase